jgi:ferritin-like metal-binding protein YciE
MPAIEEKLVEYIDDAYAMEQNVLRMLDSMIGTTEDPQMKKALERPARRPRGRPSGSRNASATTARRRRA